MNKPAKIPEPWWHNFTGWFRSFFGYSFKTWHRYH